METCQEDIYYQAMLTRDYRFDGKFFIAVKTTGIYCRPICPAKPKRQNIEFYASALLAEQKGYRPCMRCRPESAPKSPLWIGTSAIVRRALRSINNESIENEEAFAARFGVSARHLRRLFVNELGLTPKQVFDHHRLNFARKLIVETQLPLTQVALISKFNSLRRFNDAFKTRFKTTPTCVRKIKTNQPKQKVCLSLSYRPPFDWDGLLDFFKAHQVIGVDWIEGDKYFRNFKIDKTIGIFTVENIASESKLTLEIDCDNPSSLHIVVSNVRRMFDLDSDPLLIANAFEKDLLLSKLWKKYPGIRLAQAWDPFESSICTILGQLVSLKQARSLIAKLVSTYGEAVENGFVFPEVQKLARAKFNQLGTTGKRKETIRAFSRLVERNELSLSSEQDMSFFREELVKIPGIGAWSAHYISLRAMGDTDAFPRSDLILRRALELHPTIDLEELRPWRAYVAMYLWREYAQKLSKVKK